MTSANYLLYTFCTGSQQREIKSVKLCILTLPLGRQVLINLISNQGSSVIKKISLIKLTHIFQICLSTNVPRIELLKLV